MVQRTEMVCHLLGGTGRRPPVAARVRQLPVLCLPPVANLVQLPPRPEALPALPQAA